jgi:hypothetical protein
VHYFIEILKQKLRANFSQKASGSEAGIDEADLLCLYTILRDTCYFIFKKTFINKVVRGLLKLNTPSVK